MLNEEERKDLVRYRIEKAYKVFEEARDNAQLGHWNLTGNRLYYSVFHMCQALLQKYAQSDGGKYFLYQ